MLTIFGPISLDLYLPTLPQLAGDLSASPSASQLTLTVCMLGLSLGQLVAGPWSDRFGRKRPLLVGIAVFVAASVLCGLAPNLTTLLIFRFVQGLGGACGVVIAQAIGRDLYTGARLVGFYGRLAVLGGLAAIIGPSLGGQLATVTDWRGIFFVLGGIGALVLAVALLFIPETLPADRRHSGGVVDRFRGFVPLLQDPHYRGTVVTSGLMNAALFAYLAGATFVMQVIYGLSPQVYALAFGLSSLTYALSAYLAGRLASRLSARSVIWIGLVVAAAGSVGIGVTALARLALAAMMISILVMVAGIALATPALTSTALEGYPGSAGTASSLVGLARYAFGAAAAPLVGLAGEASAVPMGIVTLTALILAILTFTVTPRTSHTAGADPHLPPNHSGPDNQEPREQEMR